jgi:high-affinity iron transporter
MLLWHCIWVSAHGREMAGHARRLGNSAQQAPGRPWPLLVAVALTVLREGAETVLFVGGSVTGAGAAPAGTLLMSCLVGLGLGAMAGYLIYAGLARIPVRHLFTATNVLVALLAGSIASQLARALAQAGLIDLWSSPLWDSSRWLATDSALGTLLHALAGYDAQPSGAQLAAYFGVLALIAFATRAMARRAPARR